MAVYNSVQMTAPRLPISGVGLDGRTVHSARAEVNITAGMTLTTADVINLFQLPSQSRIVHAAIKADKVDTGTTLRVNVGTADNTSLIFAGVNAGTAAGAPVQGLAAMNPAGYDFVTTARLTTFQLRPSANAAGVQAGRIVVMVEYVIDNPA